MPDQLFRPSERHPLHYYGDIVRKLFLLSTIIMVIAYPYFSARINVPEFFSILAMIIGVILGGFLQPFHKLIISLSFIASMFAFIVFELIAIGAYTSVASLNDLFFWLNQILATLFLIALYYSSKTFRSSFLK